MNKKVGYIVAILFLIVSVAINSETQAAGTEYLFEGSELPANLTYPMNATYTVRFTEAIIQNNHNATITLPKLYDKRVTLIFEKDIKGSKQLRINFTQSINNGNGINTVIFKGNVGIEVIIGADSLNGDFGKRNSCSINLEVYGDILKNLSITSTGHDGNEVLWPFTGSSGGNGGVIKAYFHKNILGGILLQSFGGKKGQFGPVSDGDGGSILTYIKGNLKGSVKQISRSRVSSAYGSPISSYCTYDADLSKISQDTDHTKTLQSSGYSASNPEQNVVQMQSFSSTIYCDEQSDFFVDGNNPFTTTFSYAYNPAISPLQFSDPVFGDIILQPSMEVTRYRIEETDGDVLHENTAYHLPLPGTMEQLPVKELCNLADNFAEKGMRYKITVKDLFTDKTYDYTWERNFVNVVKEIPEVTMQVYDVNEGELGGYIFPYEDAQNTTSQFIYMTNEIQLLFPGFELNDFIKKYITEHTKVYLWQNNKNHEILLQGFDKDILNMKIPSTVMNTIIFSGQPFTIEIDYINPFSGKYEGPYYKSIVLSHKDLRIPEIVIVKNSQFDESGLTIVPTTFGDTMEHYTADGTRTDNFTLTGTGMIQKVHFVALLKDRIGLPEAILDADYISSHLRIVLNDEVIYRYSAVVAGNGMGFDGTIIITPVEGYTSTSKAALWRIVLVYDGTRRNFFDNCVLEVQLVDITDSAGNKPDTDKVQVYTPATQFKVDTDPASTLLAEELTISELSYMQDTEDYYRMSMYLDLDTIRCTTYDITLMLNGVEQTLADFVQGISGNGFTASDKLRLINLPVSSGTVSIRYITKSKNGFATVGDALVISESAIVQYLGKVIDLAPDFSAQKDIYLNWPKSPLYASKSIYIPKDCTLHIQGYTRLVFTLPIANEGLLIEQNKKIIVDGTLIIDGQPESGTGKYPYISGVAMSGNTNAPAYFGGIYIQRGGNLFLNAVVISYASAALFFDHTESMQLVMGMSADAFKTAYAGTNTGTSHVCIGTLSIGQSKIALFFYSRTGGSIYEQIVRAALTGWFEGSIPAIELKDKDSIAESKILIRLSDTITAWYDSVKQQVYYRYITMFK